jgi:hypothetical protein
MADEVVPTFTDRVAIAAISVRPSRLLLTWLAVPFYVLGWLLGLLFGVPMDSLFEQAGA